MIELSQNDFGYWIRNSAKPETLVYRNWALPCPSGGLDIYELLTPTGRPPIIPVKAVFRAENRVDARRELLERAKRAESIINRVHDLPAVAA